MTDTSTKLNVKVVPGASSTKIAGWLEETLRIRVAAPPEKGKANKAVIAVLASALGVPKKAVTITTGETSQNKTVEIKGLALAAIQQKLGV